jgi:hypothetical protein
LRQLKGKSVAHRTKIELKQYLEDQGVVVEDEDYLWAIQKKGYQVESDEGTLGGYHLEAFLPPEGQTVSALIHKDADGSDEDDDGRNHAALALFVAILQHEHELGIS